MPPPDLAEKQRVVGAPHDIGDGGFPGDTDGHPDAGTPAHRLTAHSDPAADQFLDPRRLVFGGDGIHGFGGHDHELVAAEAGDHIVGVQIVP